jgi:hypothetical protein
MERRNHHHEFPLPPSAPGCDHLIQPRWSNTPQPGAIRRENAANDITQFTMKTISFDNLSFDEKAWLVYSFGTYLISAGNGDNRIHLFSLDGVLIEISLKISTRCIDNIRMIRYADLDKYLDVIALKITV